jgi:hypothetical protein
MLNGKGIRAAESGIFLAQRITARIAWADRSDFECSTNEAARVRNRRIESGIS